MQRPETRGCGMSVKLVSRAFETTLPPTEKLILICLADATNDDGRGCWPALATLARKCSVSDRTVRRALSKMEEHGLLSREFRTGRSTIIRLHPEAWPERSPVSPACPTGQTPDKLSGVSDCHPGHGCPPTPDTGVPQNHKRTKRSPVARKEVSTEVNSSRYWAGTGKHDNARMASPAEEEAF